MGEPALTELHPLIERLLRESRFNRARMSPVQRDPSFP